MVYLEELTPGWKGLFWLTVSEGFQSAEVRMAGTTLSAGEVVAKAGSSRSGLGSRKLWNWGWAENLKVLVLVTYFHQPCSTS